MDLSAMAATTQTLLTTLAWKMAGAVVLWIAGRWLIRLALRVLGRSLAKHRRSFGTSMAWSMDIQTHFLS